MEPNRIRQYSGIDWATEAHELGHIKYDRRGAGWAIYITDMTERASAKRGRMGPENGYALTRAIPGAGRGGVPERE